MDDTRFDNLLRSFSSGASRRGAMGLLLGGSVALLGLAETAAKNGKGKGKGKGGKKSTPAPPPLTCEKQCPESTTYCGYRVSGGPLCAGVVVSYQDPCRTCSSDQNCMGSGLPYCITSLVRRDGGTLPAFPARTPEGHATALDSPDLRYRLLLTSSLSIHVLGSAGIESPPSPPRSPAVPRVEAEAAVDGSVEARFERQSDRALACRADRRVKLPAAVIWSDRCRP